MTDEQKLLFSEQRQTINEQKQNFQVLIDKLIQNKQSFLQELQKFEKTTDKLKEIFTPEQTAKYLIFVEKVSNAYQICS